MTALAAFLTLIATQIAGWRSLPSSDDTALLQRLITPLAVPLVTDALSASGLDFSDDVQRIFQPEEREFLEWFGEEFGSNQGPQGTPSSPHMDRLTCLVFVYPENALPRDAPTGVWTCEIKNMVPPDRALLHRATDETSEDPTRHTTECAVLWARQRSRRVTNVVGECQAIVEAIDATTHGMEYQLFYMRILAEYSSERKRWTLRSATVHPFGEQ